MWRKALRICKLTLCCAAFAAASSLIFADGSIFDRKMPTIESPTIGDGMYVPGNGKNSAYTGPFSKQQTAPSSPTDSPTSAAGTETASSSGKSTTDSSVTAKDLQTLGSRGLLSQLSTFFSERDSTFPGLTGTAFSAVPASRVSDSERTNMLLQKVLSGLEEIKAGNNAVAASSAGEKASSSKIASDGTVQTVSEVSASMQTSSTSTVAPVVKQSRLLRFTVNGYNVLRTCRTIYISDVQSDGSFLVTGDRRYMSDGKTCSETFHLLFKTQPEDSAQTGYNAATAVTQDSFNPNSFVYQMSTRTDLTASRTGNLVSMRTEDPAWRLELLIDLGE